MNAWLVSGDDWCEVIFADTRGKARYSAAREFEEEEPLALSVRRGRRLDHLAPGPITDRQRWENGIGVCCSGCFGPIWHDDPRDEGEALFFMGEYAYHWGCVPQAARRPEAPAGGEELQHGE